MKFFVRPVDSDCDRSELLRLLSRNLAGVAHHRRQQWLYRENPSGKARSWFVCEQQTEAPVGVATLFPRPMWVDGEAANSGQIGDFAIDRAYRSLGPAVLLQRATFAPVLDGTLLFCYDCPPHEAGMATFIRLGIRPACRMESYAQLLRSEEQLRRRLGEVGARTMAPLVDSLLRHCIRSADPPSDIRIALHREPFGPEFTALDLRVSSRGLVRSRRSAQDLQWRFRGDPLRSYAALTARRESELLAYVVMFFDDGHNAYVADLFGMGLDTLGRPLLRAASELARGAGMQTIRALIAGGSGLEDVFRGAGFSRRAAGPAVVPFANGSPARLEGLAWDFQQINIMA